jgi:EAL domain-containing protein (putative c-di-GMP-specific phosphodiesterase class I)
VNLSSARIEGVEALVRWQHPELGLISPADFVPVAEECGAITTITEWMVRQACIQHHAWSSTLGSQTPRISVNLSRIDLSVPDLAARFTAILAESGVSPRSVSLEVTETAVMRDHKSAVSALRKLRDAGFRLALDDFGTGYSSLSTLHQFPLDVVKLDRSFLANSVQRREYAALVQALVTLAGNLGMSVTAEGIETAEQVAMLQAVECQHAQGWFFGKPMSAADLAARILAQGDEHEQGGAARTRIAA